ncbi:type VI secretion system Vgr family protein [Pseudoxanthomonas suwonensis]|uniref:Uncharacterized protein n=1 Tax=Pseudoxanthomonas suwonensis TaxID=314722 RepID=A0A0E3Z013_9GAMM|nr:type VI secretion system tip protein TssI/VgrG [Pseudoxanthomonas suwonensis]AKC85903.1 hypothetical protein WQ53_03140 [Pseudoxanthomonas suwonensis]
MGYTTSRRMYQLSTPLGEDALLIQEFEGVEGVSRPFEFRLDVLSERDDIDPAELIGKRVTLRIETDEDSRHWTGIVSAFVRMGQIDDPATDGNLLTCYRCTIVPWLWPLTLNEDSRIFQQTSIPDIVEAMLGEYNLRDYELELRGAYPQLDYCTQYRESDFNFISRLLERAGIHYYVKYGPQAETLVFTDNNDSHPRLERDLIRYAEARAAEEEDTVTALVHRSQLRSGRMVMRDYNFEKPTDTLEASVDSLVSLGDNQNYERFLYPGDYGQRDEGEQAARVRMEAEEAEHEILDGASDVRTLTPGYCFELDGHPQKSINREYMVLSVTHRGNSNVGRESAASSYSNTFSMIPRKVAYRDPRATPKATIHGPQTAVVTGPSGEEIYTDKYGRIKVQFHWDRRGEYNDKSSRWVRVVHGHAGSRWGMFMLPRIGEEVLVAFEHGDPDRPLVVGSLYNANNMPPYDLPGEATKSTLKSNSSKGGDGFNELRFEDKAGSEEVFLHAQKDLQTQVLNNSTASVGANQQLTVGANQLIHVGKERHLVVGEREFVKVEKDVFTEIGGSTSFQAGQDLHLSVGMDTAIDAGMDIHLKAGVNIVLDAGVQISLKAGGSSITIGPAGVTLDGALVRVNCGGSPLSAKKGNKPDKAKLADAAIKGVAGKVSNPGQQAQAQALRKAAAQAQPFCAECEAARAALRALA